MAKWSINEKNNVRGKRLAVMETRVCGKRGPTIPTSPQDILELFKVLDESPENLLSIFAQCIKYRESAWHYNFDIFKNQKKVGLISVRQEELRVKKITIDGCDAVLTSEGEDGVSISCLSLPRCISQGESEEEAIKNIKEAMQTYMEVAKKYKVPLRR